MKLEITLTLILSVGLTWLVSYAYFSRKIRRQTKKMVQVMKADELKLDQPEDAFEDNDGQFFADLERASFNLRRKYLRLKKNSKEERAAFETMFSGLNEAIITVDPQMRLISFNSSFFKLFNWLPQQQVLGSQTVLQDVIREPLVISAFKDCFKTKAQQRLKLENFDLFVVQLPAIEDQPEWALGVFYDTTEIHKVEKIKVDFVANASHELRTPLTIIRGYSDILFQKVKSEAPQLENLILPIVESSHNMSHLVDDLLNLSKLDHIDQVQKMKVSTTEITQNVLDEVDTLLTMYKKRIKCSFQAAFVSADISALQQIIRNLIVNAIRYSGFQAHAEEIVLSWEKNSQGVVLKVKDFGPGISPEHQSRIFERFYRVDRSRHRDQGGTGLGLSLVKHHVQSHGGQVYIESSEGAGCEFICIFPE